MQIVLLSASSQQHRVNPQIENSALGFNLLCLLLSLLFTCLDDRGEGTRWVLMDAVQKK